MAATKANRRPTRVITTTLREDLIPGSAPFKVDRAQGIIFRVKVVGRESPNTHGVAGVSGTVYTERALREALGRYEGAKVNVDHPDREKPNKDRSSYDRVGKLANAFVEGGEIYADMHLLLEHPMSARLMEAAERMPDLFACSHNARGKGRVENGKYVIDHIDHVRSVDVVADGGTTRTLFESQEPTMKRKKLRELIESLKPRKTRQLFAPLLEDDALADMPAAYEAEEDGDWKQCVVDAIGKLISSEDSADHDMAKKLMALLKPETAKEEPEEEDLEEDDEEEDGTVEESRRSKRSKDPHVRELQEQLQRLTAERDQARLRDHIRDECGRLQLVADKTLLESLELMRDKKAITKHLEYLKKLTPRKGTSTPRSQAPGDTRALQESADPNTIPEKAADQLNWLRN